MPKKLYPYKYDGEPISPGGSILETAKFHGMSEADLCLRTGYAPAHIAGILRGDSPITDEFARLLEQILGMSADCILRFEDEYRRQKGEWAAASIP